MFHLLLFFLTFITCTVFGFALLQSFSNGQGLDLAFIGEGYTRLAHGDGNVFSGMYFSVPLLVILLAHEIGHYLACKRWGVQASLPYFLPSPTLLGTLGAFIRIRSPIYTRSSLFDIGASGPIAGFIVLIPFLIFGIHWSREIPGIGVHGDMTFGTPLLLRLAEALQFPGVPAADISLHPMAVAAWAGLVATATNLLPVGQLDGGHILYSVLGERWHRMSSNVLVLVLVGVGFVYRPWWLLAVLLFLFGRRHPLVYDQTPVDNRRRLISVITPAIFLVSILLAPVEVHIR
jgi:Zn-dependent protease